MLWHSSKYECYIDILFLHKNMLCVLLKSATLITDIFFFLWRNKKKKKLFIEKGAPFLEQRSVYFIAEI